MADEPHHRLLRYLMATPVTPGGRTLADVLKGTKKDEMAELEEKESQYNPVLGKLAFQHHLAKMASHYKEAPFKSQAQRRKFYAMEDRGEISKKTLNKWESETPKGKKLPERVEKSAGSLLGMGGMAASLFGKSKALRTAGGGMFAADYGVEGFRTKPPSATKDPAVARFKMLKRTSVTDQLIAMTKEAIEVRDKTPGSAEIPVDTAGHPPYEKKNYLKESSDRTASHGAATESGTSSPTGGHGLPMDKVAIIKARLVKNWTKGVPGTERMTRAQAPEHLQEAGKAVGVGSQGGGAPHIQRGNV